MSCVDLKPLVQDARPSQGGKWKGEQAWLYILQEEATMDIEAAIQELQRLYPDFRVGDTARPGSAYYQAAQCLSFHRCTCSEQPEFVAIGPRGGAHHVGVDMVGRVISCGPKGYHQHRRPVCTPPTPTGRALVPYRGSEPAVQ